MMLLIGNLVAYALNVSISTLPFDILVLQSEITGKHRCRNIGNISFETFFFLCSLYILLEIGKANWLLYLANVRFSYN